MTVSFDQTRPDPIGAAIVALDMPALVRAALHRVDAGKP
jgi:hypothetical protein